MLQKDLDYIVGVLVRLGQDDAAKKLLKDVKVTQETFSFPPYNPVSRPTYPSLPYTMPLSPYQPNTYPGPTWINKPINVCSQGSVAQPKNFF